MKTILGFAVGATLGSLITWRFVKKKYTDIAEEEIDSVRKYYQEKYGKKSEEKDSEKESDGKERFVPTEEEQEEAEEVINNAGYGGRAVSQKGEVAGHPYVITPDAFANENVYYDKITLTYYTDTGVIEDEDGSSLYTLPEVDNMIGLNNLDSMGEYEAHTLYIRNDILETDYEVIEDTAK